MHPMNRYLLAVATLVSLTTSPAWATDYTWTGTGEGSNPRHWSEPTNWSPQGVPGVNDTATIQGPTPPDGYSIEVGTVTVRGLTVLPRADLGLGTITVQGASGGPGVFDWKGGSLSCTVNIAAEATLNLLGGEKTLQAGTINNAGTAVWTEGQISGADDATFNNSGTFNAAFDGTLAYSAGTNSAVFNNTGTFVKTGGTGTTHIDNPWGFHTKGVVRVNSGTLALHSGGHELSQGARFEGGQTVFSFGGWTTDKADFLLTGTVTIASGARVELGDGSRLNGLGTFTGAGTLAWTGGEIIGNFGQNSVTVDSGVTFEIGGSATKSMDEGAIVYIRGPGVWSGTGNVIVSGSTLDNSGTFSVRGDALMTYNGAGTFKNSGTFIKEGSPGVTTIEDEFDNSGTVVLKSGTLLFDHEYYAPFVHSSGVLSLEGGTLVAREGTAATGTREAIEFKGGTVQGTGTLDANVRNSGATFSPGADGIGTLSITGDYTQSAGAQLLVDVGPSTHDVLAVGGASTLDGTLTVRVQNGFTPAKGASFQVLTSQSLNGTFSSVSGNTLETHYNPSDVTLGSTTDKGGGCSSTNGLAAPLALLVLALGCLPRSRRSRTS